MGKAWIFNGFSLIELLIVLAIIGLVSSVTVPKLFKLYQRSTEYLQLQDFAGQLKKIQQQAWKEGNNIRLQSDNHQNWPSSPVGWEIKQRPALYFLATGLTNGGKIIFKSPSQRLWMLKLTQLEGKISLEPVAK